MPAHRAAALATIAAILLGCAATTAPTGVRGTLGQVEALGYRCDSGVPDNVPSGLTQWTCSGTVAGAAAVVDVDGNEHGVAEITLDVRSVDPALARAEFRRLAAGIASLSRDPALGTALDRWTGTQRPVKIDGIGVNATCDATQCIVYIGFMPAPSQPIGLR